MLNALDIIGEGQRAHDRLVRMIRADVPIERDHLLCLIGKMGAAMDQQMPRGQGDAHAGAVSRGFAPIVHRGGRS